ncbi:hypothetical protein IPL68_04140 [Candidatus Saccharibacteria bacterium]|nr:MAG: hypothetical protein IPL68_04140 [Candidatus Saccharibacteria bacterium]
MIHHLDAHYAALSWAAKTMDKLRGFPAEIVANHVVWALGEMTPLEQGKRLKGACI